MIEAVTRAKGLLSLAVELGFSEISNMVHLGTDSSTAKSFVSRRGLGKMKHLEVRDLTVAEGKVVVSKVQGVENPADLKTKLLSLEEIRAKLEEMNLKLVRRG